MDLEVGSVLTGKVTGITKFGAFVSLAPGKSGLVHISEISNTYVNDIHAHLTEGQEVKVKVIDIDSNGRINLSIKSALPSAPARQQRVSESSARPYPAREQGGRQSSYQASGAQRSSSQGGARYAQSPAFGAEAPQAPVDSDFEDKLKRFMQDSENKISGIRQYSEKRISRRGGRGSH